LLGLTFALVQGVHLGMIAMLWQYGAALGVSSLSVGWLALLMVAVMAATSNDLSRQKLGAGWKRLHTTGGFLIAYVFGLSLLPAIEESWIAFSEFAVLCLGLCGRLIAHWLNGPKRARKIHHAGSRTTGIAALILASLVSGPLRANDAPDDERDKRPGEIDQTALRPLIDHRPGPTLPFGRAHPDAPQELAQFGFLVGEYECLERIRIETGKWLKFRAIWRGRYILGGMGIQDEYWTAQVFATSVRVYDPKAKRWIVDFYRMPGFDKSNWHGLTRGETMVMRRLGSSDDGPTFSEITAQGFRWNSGGRDPNWLSTCRRMSGPLDTSK
jgi:hypothetical protein